MDFTNVLHQPLATLNQPIKTHLKNVESLVFKKPISSLELVSHNKEPLKIFAIKKEMMPVSNAWPTVHVEQTAQADALLVILLLESKSAR